MEAIPRKYGEWSQFDRYCKLVLYHEAIDYLREMKCRRDREVSLDAVSPADWDKLSTVDRYSCDSFTFSSHGYGRGVLWGIHIGEPSEGQYHTNRSESTPAHHFAYRKCSLFSSFLLSGTGWPVTFLFFIII